MSGFRPGAGMKALGHPGPSAGGGPGPQGEPAGRHKAAGSAGGQSGVRRQGPQGLPWSRDPSPRAERSCRMPFSQRRDLCLGIPSSSRELPRWLSGQESACSCRRHRKCRIDPWVRQIPWRRKRQPTPGFLMGKFHGQRSLVGYTPWGRKESYITERLSNNDGKRQIRGGDKRQISRQRKRQGNVTYQPLQRINVSEICKYSAMR